MDISFSKITLPSSGTVVFLVGGDLKLPTLAVDIDKKIGGAISKAIKTADYKGAFGSFLSVMANDAVNVDRIIIAGLGGNSGNKNKDSKDKNEPEEDVTSRSLANLGGKIYDVIDKARAKNVSVIVDNKLSKFSKSDIAANIAYGIELKNYGFLKYFTKKKDDEKPCLKSVAILLDESQPASEQYQYLKSVAEGVYITRDLVSEPPNVLNPETYAEKCKDLKKFGLKVEILDEAKMQKLGMGALLGVGQGSAKESRLVVLQWNGAPRGADPTPIAFVGKGVTFDTGGISIKPSNGMEDMKYDMAGSAAVVGVMSVLAKRKAKVNAVGVIGLVENMPGGNAQRPSDVVKTMSGQTIAVLNTDAEGRLVLADALWYTQSRFKPRFMVDLATLTGAIVVALANQYAGLFSNNDELANRLFKAGEETGEKLWRFPMTKEYDKMIDSKIADVQNISNGKGAGSITAAHFLKRFVNDVPWAHLDIAGMAWADKPLDTVPEGASGYGVRLLNKLVEDYYEAR